MITPNDANHRAQIDADGNIILPGVASRMENIVPDADETVMKEGEWYAPSMEAPYMPWMTTESGENNSIVFPELHSTLQDVSDESSDDSVLQRIELPDPIAAMLAAGDEEDFTIRDAEAFESAADLWQNVRGQVFAVTNDLVAESGRQYVSSMKDGLHTGRGAVRSLSRGVTRSWNFLTQPVWVPGKNDEPKQYGRGTLFVLDVVRFGGTFASLFVVLFVSLNFQSFWSIAHSYIEPLADVAAGKQLSSELDPTLADKLKKIPALATAGSAAGDMVAYLPEVGPPDDRLIIPKMNLNVPIVIPPPTNLLKEDWKGLEEDIQNSLQDGVVHYPGTARPGQAGNFFVTGHSSYFPWAPGKYKSVFARLPDLSVGDEYWVYYGGDKYRYVITEKKEINPSDVTVLDQPVGKRIGSLMTCTPIGTTLRRLIMIAQEVDPVTAQPMKVGEHGHEQAAPLKKMEMLPI